MEFSEVTDTTDKTYIVIGAKRSGTSFLTKALGEQGIDFDICGNGHNEDLEFVRFNQKILTEAGGDWNNLPDDSKIKKVFDKYRNELRNLLRRKKKRSWGWKDPRQGATIKHFLPYLEDDVYLVCIFRRPERVADSYTRIWNSRREEALETTREYNKRIIEAIKEFCDV